MILKEKLFLLLVKMVSIWQNLQCEVTHHKSWHWIGPLIVDAAIKVKAVILFGYHGKLIKLAGGIFHT